MDTAIPATRTIFCDPLARTPNPSRHHPPAGCGQVRGLHPHPLPGLRPHGGGGRDFRSLIMAENAALAKPEFYDRFVAKIAIAGEDECWPWLACKNKGYGRFMLHGKARRAHRVSYELFAAPIPPGLVIDHLCRNRSCCNPKHMEIVTSHENTLRGKAGQHIIERWKTVTACKRGHPFELHARRNKYGRRHCKLCAAIAAREKRHNEKREREAVL